MFLVCFEYIKISVPIFEIFVVQVLNNGNKLSKPWANKLFKVCG
jgi:hypothetical protein